MFIDGIQTVIVNQGITLSGENPSSTITGPIDNLGTVAQNGAGQMTLTEVVNGGSVTVGKRRHGDLTGPLRQRWRHDHRRGRHLQHHRQPIMTSGPGQPRSMACSSRPTSTSAEAS